MTTTQQRAQHRTDRLLRYIEQAKTPAIAIKRPKEASGSLEGLEAHGRGEPSARAILDESGVTIRIDDYTDTEAWTEVYLTERQLRTWLAKVVGLQGDALKTLPCGHDPFECPCGTMCEFCGPEGGPCAVCGSDNHPALTVGERQR